MIKVCPYIKEPCIGIACSEFVPRHTRIGYYNWGIQDEFMKLWCMLTMQEYTEQTCVVQVCAHCKQGMSAAYRWDK
jgi:hypothetical protein